MAGTTVTCSVLPALMGRGFCRHHHAQLGHGLLKEVMAELLCLRKGT